MGLVLILAFKEKFCGHQKLSDEKADPQAVARVVCAQGASLFPGRFFLSWFTGQLCHNWGMWLPGLSWFGSRSLEWYNWGNHTADVLQWHLMSRSQLPKNPQNPKSQKIVSSSDVSGNSFVLSIRKKKAFWRVWFSTTWGKCGWVLLHQIHFSYECWRRADPSGSTWGGDALVILMGSIDESWPDIKLIKLCSFKTQEGVITIWPSSFFILLCYPSSFTLLFQRATKRKVIMINYRKLAATVINR